MSAGESRGPRRRLRGRVDPEPAVRLISDGDPKSIGSEVKERTVLVADLVGTHQLLERMGEGPGRRALNRLVVQLQATAKEHGGEVSTSKGDRIVAGYPDPAAATRAARRLQSALVEAPEELGLRMGLHHGDTQFTAGRITGTALEIAMRTAAVAKRSQVVGTAATLSVSGYETAPLGRIRVHGPTAELELSVLLGGETSPERVDAENLHNAGPLVIANQQTHTTLTAEESRAVVGRRPGAAIQMIAPWVSRDHVEIFGDGDWWVLRDRSTNGTWVKIKDNEVHVRDSNIRLVGAGLIGVGRPPESEPSTALVFAVGHRAVQRTLVQMGHITNDLDKPREAGEGDSAAATQVGGSTTVASHSEGNGPHSLEPSELARVAPASAESDATYADVPRPEPRPDSADPDKGRAGDRSADKAPGRHGNDLGLGS